MHVSMLPLKRNTMRATDRLAFARAAGYTVELYSIRVCLIQTGYARGGLPGALGPVCGYGVSVEDAEGCTVYVDESRDRAACEAIYAKAVAQCERRALKRCS